MLFSSHVRKVGTWPGGAGGQGLERLRKNLKQPQPGLVISDSLEKLPPQFISEERRKEHVEGGGWDCWAWRRMGDTSLGSGRSSVGESIPQEPGPGPPANRPASLQAGAWTTVPGDARCAPRCGEHRL